MRNADEECPEWEGWLMAALAGFAVGVTATLLCTPDKRSAPASAPPPAPPPPDHPPPVAMSLHEVFEEAAAHILKVPADPSREDIQRAFRERIREVHPDLTGTDTVALTRSALWARDFLLHRCGPPQGAKAM